MRESKYGIGDGLQSGFLGGITYRITDRWLDGENEWHYRVSCDVWLSESQIVQMPDADVVAVVRCCECVYHDDESQYHYCRKWRRNCPDDSDFFCKWGKRKNGGQDE